VRGKNKIIVSFVIIFCIFLFLIFENFRSVGGTSNQSENNGDKVPAVFCWQQTLTKLEGVVYIGIVSLLFLYISLVFQKCIDK
jgi:hypothetical protein